jgi:hypothetical protein
METAASRVFATEVNLPRSYMGKAGLRVGPDSVTLIARPIRHYRAIVLSYVGAVLVLGAIVLLALPGSWEFRSLVVGVIAGVLAGGIFASLRSSGGESRSMSLPLTAVSLVKRNGRVLVLGASFDSRVRSGRWTLVADTRDDADTIASALTTGGG